MLGTSPSIDPAAVPVRSTASPRRAGEGRGALSSMRDVATAVGEFKTKLRDVAQDLGDVGALHETTMPRARRHLDKVAKSLDEIQQLGGGARVTATPVEEDVGEGEDDAAPSTSTTLSRAPLASTLSPPSTSTASIPLWISPVGGQGDARHERRVQVRLHRQQLQGAGGAARKIPPSRSGHHGVPVQPVRNQEPGTNAEIKACAEDRGEVGTCDEAAGTFRLGWCGSSARRQGEGQRPGRPSGAVRVEVPRGVRRGRRRGHSMEFRQVSRRTRRRAGEEVRRAVRRENHRTRQRRRHRRLLRRVAIETAVADEEKNSTIRHRARR